ncbi:MAG: PspC domain-containing protein [Paludibacteraceae bacterium]|nr:PspC domain-containing protein [Paludibacteraceae bacterium]
MEKKLRKSSNKMLAGVCAGIAEYMDIDPTLVRVIYAACSVFLAGFPGLILYLILCLIMPAPEQNV